MQIREFLSILLAAILFANLPAQARMQATGGTPPEDKNAAHVAKQIVGMEKDALVEVKTKNKGVLRGRLGQVSPDGFVLLAAKDNQVGEQKLAFSDVASVKKVEKTGTSGKRVALYILAGVGVLIAVVAVVAAAGGISN